MRARVNRVRLVREVYAELRAEVGNRVSAAETLAAAVSLVDLFADPAEEPDYEIRSGGVPFARWSLDAAFADGGWRVLSQEMAAQTELLRDEAEELLIHNGMARLKKETCV